MRLQPALVPALLALVAWSGCSPSSTPPSPTPAVAAKTYRVVGVVRELDAKAGEVTLRHEAIPGLMPAMTMPFQVADRALLADLQPGDEVEGTLRVGAGDSALVDLAMTRPAPPPTLTLDLSGEAPALKPKAAALEPGQVVPDFAMTTQDGRPLRLSDLRGSVVVLTFIYTRCPLPDFCPRQDRKFAELADRVAAVPSRSSRVRLLSVSFDPEHDTPEVLRRHAREQGARPPLWTFAVASHDELAKVAGPLGLTYGPGRDEIVHNLSAAVIGPDGRLARLAAGPAGKAWTPADFLKTIHALLSTDRP